MSTQDGDPQSFAARTAVAGSRLGGALLLAGTMVCLVVVVMTFPVPGIPPLSEMERATASAPRVIVGCRTTWVGSVASEACYWTLRLDDGKELAWLGAKRKETSGHMREYLRANSPITVRFWNERLYQIELHDGEVYLDYRDVQDSERERQWIGVIFGLVVGAMSLIRIGLQLRYRRDPFTAMRAGELGASLGICCLVGALLAVAVGWPRMWIGIVGLALFATFAAAHDQTIICREQMKVLEAER